MTIVVHYGEIALKKGNRPTFERLLVENIRSKLPGSKVLREYGQLIVEHESIDEARKVLSAMPGIAHFSPAKKTSLDIEDIKRTVISIIRDIRFSTFRITSKRHNKGYRLDSRELNQILGSLVIEKTGSKAKMDSPDLDLRVEISDRYAYLSTEKTKGIGGLPTDSRQKIVALLSGGFDSPVAAFMMMRRGAEVILVHCQNRSAMQGSVEDKVSRIADVLSRYQQKTLLYIVPFEGIQKEIIKSVKAEERMLIYRRFMLLIGGKIADMKNAPFIVTGDNLCQVASQTMENLLATYSGLPKPVLTPLIGMNKDEIIDISKRIGTHDISILPYGDCCSFFLPLHPILKADEGMVTSCLSSFSSAEMVESAVLASRVLSFPAVRQERQ